MNEDTKTLLEKIISAGIIALPIIVWRRRNRRLSKRIDELSDALTRYVDFHDNSHDRYNTANTTTWQRHNSRHEIILSRLEKLERHMARTEEAFPELREPDTEQPTAKPADSAPTLEEHAIE